MSESQKQIRTGTRSRSRKHRNQNDKDNSSIGFHSTTKGQSNLDIVLTKGSKSGSKSRSRSNSISRKRKRDSRHRKSTTSASSSSSTSSSSSSSQSIISTSQSPDHFKYKIGQTIKKGMYKIKKHLNDGTFGRVLLVKNTKTGKQYAMKVIRESQNYLESARDEADVLQDVKKAKLPYIVKLKDCFSYRKTFIMIFERLGSSLSDILRNNENKPLPMPMLQTVLKQMLEGILSLHKLGITHTDLKPENILFKYSNTTSSENNGVKTEWPTCPDIKIIDLGGAVYDKDRHDGIVNTRQYRAPEVTLRCCSWGHASDVWGIGCIAMEMYTGDLLFQTRKNELEHLALIEKICGPIKRWMAQRIRGPLRRQFIAEKKYFREHGSYFQIGYLTQASALKVKQQATLSELIKKEDTIFGDLMSDLLQTDPDNRITCEQALKHPFFNIKY